MSMQGTPYGSSPDWYGYIWTEVPCVWHLVGGVDVDKRKVDVTDKVLEAPLLEGKLKAYDFMMRQNKGSIVEEGGYGQRAAKAAKASKKRNRDATKTDR